MDLSKPPLKSLKSVSEKNLELHFSWKTHETSSEIAFHSTEEIFCQTTDGVPKLNQLWEIILIYRSR